MKRRDFLGLTGAAVAVLGPSTVSAPNEVTAPILQTEDGILIEDATDPLPKMYRSAHRLCIQPMTIGDVGLCNTLLSYVRPKQSHEDQAR